MEGKGKGKGKGKAVTISNVFKIKLEWLEPGLLDVNSKASLRDAVRKLSVVEEDGNIYTTAWGGLSWRQVLLDEIEIAEGGMQPEEKKKWFMYELVDFKATLRNSIKPPGLKMCLDILDQLEYHPLVQLCEEKLQFIYYAWMDISRSKVNKLEFKDMFPSRFEKIETRINDMLRPDLKKAFSKIYASEKRVSYEDNALGVLDFAKNILNHINDGPRIEMNTRLQNYWMKDTKGSTIWIRKDKAERGIAHCFPELAVQIFTFCNEKGIKIRSLFFSGEAPRAVDPWMTPVTDAMATRGKLKADGRETIMTSSWKGVASGEVSVQYKEYDAPPQSSINVNATGGDSAAPSQHAKAIPSEVEKDLVQRIKNTIEEAGGRILTNSIAGILDSKKWTWNKQQHGSLQKFIEAHKETFVMDKKSGYSSLSDIPETTEAQELEAQSSSLSSALADDSIEKTPEALSSSSLSLGLIDDSIATKDVAPGHSKPASKKKKKGSAKKHR